MSQKNVYSIPIMMHPDTPEPVIAMAKTALLEQARLRASECGVLTGIEQIYDVVDKTPVYDEDGKFLYDARAFSAEVEYEHGELDGS